MIIANNNSQTLMQTIETYESCIPSNSPLDPSDCNVQDSDAETNHHVESPSPSNNNAATSTLPAHPIIRMINQTLFPKKSSNPRFRTMVK